MTRRRAVAILAGFALAGCFGPRDPGIGYTYECRPAADGRKILARVHALETYGGGQAVLVSIADGPTDPRAPKIAFAAFSRKTFVRSCPARSSKAVLRPDPRFNDTYRRWQAELKSGKAGVYEVSVADAVADFRALPVPPFVGDPGEPAAAGLLGPGPHAVRHLVVPPR
jgi:hypothetical protein